MGAAYPIKVQNNYGAAVKVYTTMSNAPTNPPSTNPEDYVPIYTLIGTVAANTTGNLTTDEAIARVVITRQSDEFPLKVSVVNVLTSGSQNITLPTAMSRPPSRDGHFTRLP